MFKKINNKQNKEANLTRGRRKQERFREVIDEREL